MIDHTLAKKLQQAGFPYSGNGGSSQTAYDENGNVITWDKRKGNWQAPIDCYIPTVRELANASGTDIDEVLAMAWLELQKRLSTPATPIL